MSPKKDIAEATDRQVANRDFVNILILIIIALAIGVYLIITTVLISKDGVFYIERAQQFMNDPVKIIKAHPPGYPFMILAVHKAISYFTHDNSNQAWIYSAQSVTLLCRLLALIPLYFIGRLLVGSKNSFFALLIFIFLPFPTKAACEVLREWPYLLFLSTGFLFLLWAAKKGKWWAFGLVGLMSGLGYLIRHESAQLVLYTLVWSVICVFRPNLWGVSRWKNLVAIILLFLGFALPVAPYMHCKGEIVPKKVNMIIKHFSMNESLDKSIEAKINSVRSRYSMAEVVPGNIMEAPVAIFKTIGENLMWFFMLPLMIGIHHRFRGNADHAELCLITTFAIVSFAMMALRYSIISEHASQRWSLPLVAFTVFYIPVGLEIMGNWLNNFRSHSRQKADSSNGRRLSWVVILFLIGIGICLPKLVRPVGIDKQGYREVARWLKENTKPEDIIATPFKRIAFYAERSVKKIEIGTNTVSGKVTTEVWSHLVATYDGKDQKLFIDGKLVSSTKPKMGGLNGGRDSLAIGKCFAEHNSYFKGSIKNVRIYSKALSDENVEALSNEQIREFENKNLIGYWPLKGNVSAVDKQSEKGMTFDGIKDYIDLSGLGTCLKVDELTISVWVKPENLKQMNWVLGNSWQFRIGVRNSKVYFWIKERAPGHKIPSEVAYVIRLTNEKTSEMNAKFNKKVKEKHSGWVAKRKKKKRIVIFKVL